MKDLSFAFFKNAYFIFLFERQLQRAEIEIFDPLVYFPNGHGGWSRANPKPRGRSRDLLEHQPDVQKVLGFGAFMVSDFWIRSTPLIKVF